MDLSTLNPQQLEAVLTTEGPLLILAGAGSGKTNVLVHRIAYLIEECRVSPFHILAITFTNKAAGEMRDRIIEMIGEKGARIWARTFHSACLQILRFEVEHTDLSPNFVIYDTSDQLSIVKRILRERNIDSDVETLKERLCAIYMLGDASTLEIILQSESVIDMAQKVELLNMITEHDTKMIQQLAADMEAIAAEKAEIESEKEQVSAARTELDSRRTDLAAVQAEADRVLRELTASVASVQQEQEEIAARKAAADKAVDDWLADYYAQQQAQQNGGSSGGGSSTGSGGYVSTGSFTWPCPGFTRITTQFNEWTYGGYHHGTDIASTGGRSIYGAPIVAADSGRVIRAGWDNSYGNCVYIDHGGGYVTRYAHASSLAVSYGQTVTKGQTIAYVGNTGDSFGAHLHFEVILNGVRQNPMNYFS